MPLYGAFFIQNTGSEGWIRTSTLFQALAKQASMSPISITPDQSVLVNSCTVIKFVCPQ